MRQPMPAPAPLPGGGGSKGGGGSNLSTLLSGMQAPGAPTGGPGVGAAGFDPSQFGRQPLPQGGLPPPMQQQGWQGQMNPWLLAMMQRRMRGAGGALPQPGGRR